ncbi:MAG TPA: SDR family NAD(P)-dependent oxidoreductase, partial [Anaerolineae bacterium]|nr:SDR family NAD(P)-dependent oxidoreductase [Anaerolineae bacterium]
MMAVPAQDDHAITRNVVRLQTLPMPDFIEIEQPSGHVCLVTEDGEGVADALLAQLAERGWQAQKVDFGDQFDEAVIADVIGRNPLNAFVFLDNAAVSAEISLKQAFFAAKYLKLNADRPIFLTATRLDGALGLDGATTFDPLRGGFFGLAKTLRLEWPTVFCRAVDLHPSFAAEDAASYLLVEMHDPNGLVSEVGYGNRGRVTLTTDAVALEAAVPSGDISVESLFVVSGGAKGITATCVLQLAQQYRSRFILLGRSALDAVDDSWVSADASTGDLKRLVMQRLIAQGEKPTPRVVNKMAKQIASQREIRATLRQIAEVGGSAEYLSVDVTDAATLQRELGAAQARLGTITGIVHGAGVLSDKLIEKKTQQDFATVYNTKVKGLQALLAAVPQNQLTHLVLFSSAAGFYGNVGQADYAVANDILNKYAHLARVTHPNCHTVAIDWGPWDGGMVTPALKKLFTERNIAVISADVGAWIMTNELSDAHAQIAQTVVGGELMPAATVTDLTLRKHRIHRHLTLEANPFLQDHVIGGNPVLPTVNAIAWMGNACEQLYPGYTLFACDNYQVLKGIVFDAEHESRDCVLDLEEVEKSAAEIRIKAIIWSQTAEGKMRFHYRAEMVLLHQLPEAPVYAGIDLAEGVTMTPKDIYGSAIFHGPLFWGVEQVINITPRKVTMRCKLPALRDEQMGQFPVQSFNPYIADP